MNLNTGVSIISGYPADCWDSLQAVNCLYAYSVVIHAVQAGNSQKSARITLREKSFFTTFTTAMRYLTARRDRVESRTLAGLTHGSGERAVAPT